MKAEEKRKLCEIAFDVKTASAGTVTQGIKLQ